MNDSRASATNFSSAGDAHEGRTFSRLAGHCLGSRMKQPLIAGGIVMAHIQAPAYTGPLVIDLNDVKDVLVDIPPGGLQGLRNEQPGIEAVLVELAHALPQYADAAEVHGAFHTRIMQSSANIDKLAEHEIILAKQLEVVRETKAQLINNREYDIGSVATKVAESATRQKKPELMALFEKTLRYRSQVGIKAMATRKKKAKAEASAPPKESP